MAMVRGAPAPARASAGHGQAKATAVHYSICFACADFGHCCARLSSPIHVSPSARAIARLHFALSGPCERIRHTRKQMANDEVGPSMPSALLYGSASGGVRACGCSDEAEGVPLPPEQRGKVHRSLADEEGDDGRWMDAPKPEEIWGGAVGLTREMFAFIPGVREPHDASNAASKQLPPRPPRSPELEEGTEMREKTPCNELGGVSTSATSDEEQYTPDCLTRMPLPGDLPAPPCVDGEAVCDSGVRARSESGRLRPYFRELPEDAGNCPPPNECFADMVQLHTQMAAAMCVAHPLICGFSALTPMRAYLAGVRCTSSSRVWRASRHGP